MITVVKGFNLFLPSYASSEKVKCAVCGRRITKETFMQCDDCNSESSVVAVVPFAPFLTLDLRTLRRMFILKSTPTSGTSAQMKRLNVDTDRFLTLADVLMPPSETALYNCYGYTILYWKPRDHCRAQHKVLPLRQVLQE